MYGIKAPSGTMITSSAREEMSDCIDDYLSKLIISGEIKVDPEKYGPEYLYDLWLDHFESRGFKVVTCIIEQHGDGVYGWPELVEIPRQESLFKSQTLIRSK